MDPKWSVIASIATAGGTLALAVATFASIRAARRGTQATERALLAAIRPLLVPSRMEDPPEKVGFQDNRWLRVEGGRAVAEASEDAIYLAMALRNAGTGLAVLDSWDYYVGDRLGEGSYRDPSTFRRLTRDIYVPGGDLGFWQGAVRDPSDPAYDELRTAIADRVRLFIDILYGDHEGGQHTITRFAMTPYGDDQWITSAGRHWNLDRADPR
jgi:hypothetical protein